MRRELQFFMDTNEHLKKFSEGQIGWPIKTAVVGPNLTKLFFDKYNDPIAQLEDLRFPNASSYIYVLVPGPHY